MVYIFAAPLPPCSSFIAEWFALWAAFSFLSTQATPLAALLLGDNSSLYQNPSLHQPRAAWKLHMKHFLSTLPVTLA